MEVSERYLPFLATESKVDILEGTTQAGKTTTAINTKFIYEIFRTKRNRHIIAGQSLGVVMANIIDNGDLGLKNNYPDIEIYLDGNRDQKLPHIKIKDQIIFLVGYDNVRRFTKVLGGQFGVVFVDEMNIAIESFINEIFLPRFEYFCGTLNPDNPNLPIYKNIINRCRPAKGHEVPNYMMEYLLEAEAHEGWHYWFYTYDDNPGIDEERRAELLTSLLPGTIQYETKIKGIRARNVDLIFGDIPQSNILIDIKKYRYKRFTAAIDTSYSKKTEDTNAFTFGGVTTTGEFVAINELVCNNKDVGKIIRVNGRQFRLPLSASEVCEVGYNFLEENRAKYGYSRDVIIDSPATTLEFDKLRREQGWIYMPTDANKIKQRVKIIDRIDLYNSWIAKGKYLISANCKNHIQELQSWSYDDKGNPEDKGNHTIDSFAYNWIPYRDQIV